MIYTFMQSALDYHRNVFDKLYNHFNNTIEKNKIII